MSRSLTVIKDLSKKSRFLRNTFRNYTQKVNQPSWLPLLEKNHKIWDDALRDSDKGQKILIATSVGGNLAGTILESTLAVALTLRGANADILLCDSFLPACFNCWIGWFSDQRQFIRNGPKNLCNSCFAPANKMFRSLGLKVHKYSECLSSSEIEEAGRISHSVLFDEIGSYRFKDISAGEHALAGALRFLARGDIKDEPCGEEILRRYFRASLLSTFAADNLLRKHDYERAIFNHGIYVPQGLIGEICRKEGIGVVNWNPGYRKKTFIFSHDNTYHHTMITEPVDKWSNIQWTAEMEDALTDYLKSRWQGTNDWIWFHEKPEFNFNKIIRETGIDPSKPCIGMLTSVMWDAQLHYSSNAFSSMLEWIEKTIDYFMKRPDLQLVIRVHPAEIRGTLPSRQKIVDQINRIYSDLPSNIIIIPPESRISTYKVMMQCDTVIIYNTKTGVELTAMGIPVVVAGEAWIKNKGLAMDVDSVASYYDILNKLPMTGKMSDDETLRARKYAYHYFFRRMIPLDFMVPTGTNPPFKIEISSIKDLMPGISTGLDVICDGILKGSDFIFQSDKNQTNP